jgi:ABC-type transport system involved in Fe-S cluster assembly fused permease/ATPase subunit
VYDACESASIHDKILTIPDKYETKIGERSLCLSGDKKQRVSYRSYDPEEPAYHYA